VVGGELYTVELEQLPQVVDGPEAVIDAKVDGAGRLADHAGQGSLHDQGRRLTASPLAAGPLGRFKSRQKPLGQIAP
jgi:hypothetical protein